MDPFPLVGKGSSGVARSLDGVYAIIHGVMGALRDLGENGRDQEIDFMDAVLARRKAISMILRGYGYSQLLRSWRWKGKRA